MEEKWFQREQVAVKFRRYRKKNIYIYIGQNFKMPEAAREK